MKLSVSLSAEDVAYLDKLAHDGAYASRSAALAAAVEMMRHRQLGTQYADAFHEWDSSDEATFWDAVSSDG